MYLSGSHCIRNSSTHVERRPWRIRKGLHRTEMWCIAVLSFAASLTLKSVMVECALRLRAAWRLAALTILGEGKWSTHFASRDAASRRRYRKLPKDSLIGCCLVYLSTTREDGLSERVPHSGSRMVRHRGAIGSYPPFGLENLLRSLCQGILSLEGIKTRKHFRTYVRDDGRGQLVLGFAVSSSRYSKK